MLQGIVPHAIATANIADTHNNECESPSSASLMGFFHSGQQAENPKRQAFQRHQRPRRIVVRPLASARMR